MVRKFQQQKRQKVESMCCVSTANLWICNPGKRLLLNISNAVGESAVNFVPKTFAGLPKCKMQIVSDVFLGQWCSFFALLVLKM